MEEGELGPDAWFYLDQSTAIALDNTEVGLNDEEHLKRLFEPSAFTRQLFKCHCLKYCLYRMRYNRVVIGYDCLLNFIECHKHVLKSQGKVTMQMCESKDELIKENLIDIKQEIMTKINKVDDIIKNEVRDSYREIMKPLHHKHAVYYSLV